MNNLRITKLQNTKGNKCLVMYRQSVDTPSSNENVMVGILNATDERFGSSERAAIIVGMHDDIAKTYPQLAEDVASLKGQPVGSIAEVDLEVPEMRGQKLNIRIVENTKQAWGGQEPKRAGKEGPVLYSNGLPIYSHTSVVLGNPAHTFLTADAEDESVAVSITDTITAEQA